VGLPAPAGLAASGLPPVGDQANAVLSGSFSAVGVSRPFAFRGPMNVAIWCAIATTMTTLAGASSGTTASDLSASLAAGQSVNSASVPPGTTIASVSTTTVNFLFPPGFTAGNVKAGTSVAASFTGAALSFNGAIQIERSFDGGYTYVPCNIGGTGTLAQYTGATVGPVSLTFGEPERQVLYRLNLTTLSSILGSGSIQYRISQTGGAAESLAIGPLSGG
jgi:hypothetical protein